MTDSLERRYRRLLALYPRSFRRDHEEEMLGVLMARARPDRTRPTAGDAIDLARSGAFMRIRRTKLPSDWEYRHARWMVPVRILSGAWMAILTVILVAYDRAGWWPAVLIPTGVLHFYLAFRLLHPSRSTRGSVGGP